MAYYRRRTRSTRSRRNRVSRRQNVWVRQQQRNSVPNTDGLSDFDCLPNTFIDTGAVVGSTVVRIRADFEISSGPITNSLAGVFFAFSIQERAPSLSEYPTPQLAMNKVDWMYWKWVPYANAAFAGFVTTVDGVETARNSHFEVDVKSSRVISAPDQTLVGMAQLVNWASIPAATVALTSSVLLKLS